MRDREATAWQEAHPAEELAPRVAQWRAEHPDGTLEDLVRDLDLWHNPRDMDAQRLAWYALQRLGDPEAAKGFPAMRDAASKLRGPSAPVAGSHQPAR